jgi:2-(1,2-epoxy-1,2-dihydrophenyl)acetyl-CoA isomerase
MTYHNISYTVNDGLARLTLNRPDKLNSFTVAMHLEVRDALDTAALDPHVRALVLTGAGRGFCAGQDLNDRTVSSDPADASVDVKPDLGESIEQYYSPLVRRLRALPKPIVCAVNGVAAGAGASIALACDIVIAVQTASFIQSFCKLGLVPDAGGTWVLPKLVGRARAMGLALLGDTLSAQQAADWGLIWKCVPTADFEAEVNAVAHKLATGPTMGFASTKKAIDAAATSTLNEQLDRERDLQRELGYSLDYAEGVAAFTQKRMPRFVGK